MKICLDQCYGPLKAAIGYEVLEEGRDFLLLKNGVHVPKNLTRPYSEVIQDYEYDYFAEDEDDY